jgi:pre-mRNA-splicing helicase BRR2
MIKFDLTLSTDFVWDNRVHEFIEPFWIFVEDANSDYILHCEYFMIDSKNASLDHTVTFTVAISDPLPPHYFIRVVSDKWLQSEIILPVSFRHLILPERFLPATELLDLQPLPISALGNTEFEALYSSSIKKFNPIQTQVFTSFYHTHDNILLAAPTGSGKTLCIEFALLRQLARESSEKDYTIRCAYVAPNKFVCSEKYHDWSSKFGTHLGLSVVTLKGDLSADIKILEHGNIIISQTENWDLITRRWKNRKSITHLDLYIIDELQLISIDNGHVIEIITSRMRFISSQIEGHSCRIIATSTSLSNAKDLARWCGANSHSFFNFSLSARPVPLQIEIRGFDIVNFETKMQAMIKPTYDVIIQRCNFRYKPVIVFVPSKYAAQVTLNLLNQTIKDGMPNRFLGCKIDEISPYLAKLQEPMLKHSLQYGLGYIYEGQSSVDRKVVETLYDSATIQVLVTSSCISWGLSQISHLVIIMGTQQCDGSEYPIVNLLNMIGRANRPKVDENSFCLLMCHGPRKEYYSQFLLDSFPLESCINNFLHDHLNAEIVTG